MRLLREQNRSMESSIEYEGSSAMQNLKKDSTVESLVVVGDMDIQNKGLSQV